jgi:hypothetical protein
MPKNLQVNKLAAKVGIIAWGASFPTFSTREGQVRFLELRGSAQDRESHQGRLLPTCAVKLTALDDLNALHFT